MSVWQGQTAAGREPAPPAVRLRGIVKAREQGGAGFELVVPRFDLARGEFVALVGESGCGKSTLLDMLALVLRPSRCEAFLLYEVDGGEPLDVFGLWSSGDEAELARLRRERLGYVLQTGGLLPFLTVRENILLSSRLKRMPLDEARFQRLMADMGLVGVLGKKPQFLSGGQRQRASILRALAHRPMMILADEPTAAVDFARARRIVADLRARARLDGASIVMVTHDQRLIDSVAERVYEYRVSQVSEALTRATCVPAS